MTDNYTAKICMNGHILAEAVEQGGIFDDDSDYCTECGGKVIMSCPLCNTQIKGLSRSATMYDGVKLPKFCHKCGKPYPWTSGKLRALEEFVKNLGLNEKDRNLLLDAIDKFEKGQLDEEGQKTLANRLKSFSGNAWKEQVRPLIVDIGSEALKKYMESKLG